MKSLRPIQSGVFRLINKGSTPFLVMLLIAGPLKATENPISVESRSSQSVNHQYTEKSSETAEVIPFQRPIEDESPNTVGSESSAVSLNNGGMEGQYQLQLLQQEVMDLRGQVENLTYQLQKMRTTQEDRYLELDKRFQNLSSSNTSAGPIINNGPSSEEVPNDDVPPVQGGQDEKTLYDTALELIRNRQYDLAISQLEAVISQYPDGEYAPNAYYWLGEVHAAKPEPDYDSARKALAQVITFFPDHRKVPDAAFKLGKVYNLMGDCTRATDILNQVIEQQKGTTVSRLAESYLKDNVICEQE